jgi:hypothetical protein
MLVPRTPHQPDRPTWDCLACGEPWPCAPGKVELAEQGVVHRRSLRLYLESCAIDMIDDRAAGHHTRGCDDAVYDRILGWLDASHPASVDRAAGRDDQPADALHARCRVCCGTHDEDEPTPYPVLGSESTP